MIQTCIYYDKITEALTCDYHRPLVKPVVVPEEGYVGVEFIKSQSVYDNRNQAYWTQQTRVSCL